MIRRAFDFDRQNGRIDLFALAGLALIGGVLAIGLPAPVAALPIAGAAGLAMFSPSAALGATLAATPLIFRPVDVGSSTWTLLELMLVAGAVGLSARIVVEILATQSIGPVRAVLPATSIERYWTSVSPSAVMVTEAPAVAVPQVDPPSVEVRYS